jgi:hypothetical protein
MTIPRRGGVLTACCLWLVLAPAVFGQGEDKIVISTVEEMTTDLSQAPCNDKDRQAAVQALLLKMGATADDITILKQGGAENVVLRKPGTGEGVIVIGAHYDKSSVGCGAIDNWTGVVAIAHLYRSLRQTPMEKTLIFVGFGKEEKGLIGSKGMVAEIKKEEVGQYCAMVNIDSLGMSAPQAMESHSSKSLSARTAAIAEKMKMPFSVASIPGAGADSTPFLEKKIPAVTISGIAQGWEKILHSPFDQVAKVNPTGVYLGYRLALTLTAELSGLPCNASREEMKKK